MKSLIDKFLSKLMDEAYVKETHRFSLKSMLTKHNIPFDPDDIVLTFTSYNGTKFTGSPLVDTGSLTLYEILQYWDEYLKNPIKDTVYTHFDFEYQTRVRKRSGKFYFTKRGFKLPVFDEYTQPAYLKDVTVIDHIKLYIVKQDKSVESYKVYVSPNYKFLHPDSDTKYYDLHIDKI